MALVLSEDQQLLKDAARSFCQQNSPIAVLRRLRDEKIPRGYDEAIWKQMLELGWTGMAVTEAYGGFEFGYAGLGIVLEETGRTLVNSPLIASTLLSTSLLSIAGNEAQKTKLLPALVAGDILMSVALDEQVQHQPHNIASTARKEDGAYIINAAKTFVLDGHIADKLIVVARTSGENTDREGISLFLVDADSECVTITRTFMLDSRNSARVELSNVRVLPEALLGEEGRGYAALEQVLDIGRIGIAAEMLGSIESVFAAILEYLKQREQFGVLIGSFQALQHRAAIMYSEIELCRSVIRAAVNSLDDPECSVEERAKFASLAKAKLSEVFELVSNEGVQMHGGIGMTDEFDIGFYLKRARVAQQFLGDATFHRDRYATLNRF